MPHQQPTARPQNLCRPLTPSSPRQSPLQQSNLRHRLDDAPRLLGIVPLRIAEGAVCTCHHFIAQALTPAEILVGIEHRPGRTNSAAVNTELPQIAQALLALRLAEMPAGRGGQPAVAGAASRRPISARLVAHDAIKRSQTRAGGKLRLSQTAASLPQPDATA